MAEVSIHAGGSNDVDELVGLMEAFYAESSFALDRQWATYRRLGLARVADGRLLMSGTLRA